MGAFVSWVKTNMPADSSKPPPSPASVSGLVSSIVVNGVPALALLIIFLFFRRSQRRFYAPRTYLGSLRHSERSLVLPNGWLSWIRAFWGMPDLLALNNQGLDAYLFLRYLRVAMIICFVSICITWPILFPVNATGMGGHSQLEILSYSNISVDKSPNRFYAHVFVAWAVYDFVMYMIMRECIFLINLRQAYMLTPHYAKRISSRTVLFTAVPKEYLNEAHIRQMFNNSVRHVWLAGKSDKLDEVVEERDKVAMKLENAEVKLIKMVHKARSKPSGKEQEAAAAEAGNVVSCYVPDKKHPSHRLGFLGLLGKKVDTIEWCRSELQKLMPEAEKLQGEWRAGNFDKVNAVFVEFHDQADAQAA